MYFIDIHGNESFDYLFYEQNVSETHIFRVHYKKKFREISDDNKVTNYGYIVRGRHEKNNE